MSDVELMVASSKQTTYMDRPAWAVPNGKVTTEFAFACSCWRHFLNGNPNWLWDAMSGRPCKQ